MKQKQIGCIICGLLLVLTIMDYRTGIIWLGEPFIFPIMEFMVADEYYGAINVPCHYMGNKLLNQELTEGTEWYEPVYGKAESRKAVCVALCKTGACVLYVVTVPYFLFTGKMPYDKVRNRTYDGGQL